MREYKPYRHTDRVPHTGWTLAIAAVRDYGRLCGIKDRSAAAGRIVGAADRALLTIPPEYRQAVFDNVRFRKPMPVTGNKNTYSRWRCAFLVAVADELGII